MVKNPNLRKANQLAIYKHEVELGPTARQLKPVVRTGLEPVEHAT